MRSVLTSGLGEDIPAFQSSQQHKTYSHQTNYSDGEIYRDIRRHQKELGSRWDPAVCELAEIGRTRYSPCKEKNFDAIYKRPQFRKALDQLSEYPGMLPYFYMANWHKYFALGLDQYVGRGLENIPDTWNEITTGVPRARRKTDPDTVKELQGLLPSEEEDRRHIEEAMADGRIWRHVTDPRERKRLERNLLSLDKMIPSLEIFHANMKYFSIAAKNIREHVVGGKAKGTRASLLDRLPWTAPTGAMIEVAEGTFKSLVTPQTATFEAAQGNLRHLFSQPATVETADCSLSLPSIARDQAMVQLFLFHLRHYKSINAKNEVYLRRSNALAGVLGFSTEKTRTELRNNPLPDLPDIGQDAEFSSWRWGTPPLKVYYDLLHNSFLPTLSDANAGMGVTPTMVLKEFIRAFFGPSTYRINASSTTIKLHDLLDHRFGALRFPDIPLPDRSDDHSMGPIMEDQEMVDYTFATEQDGVYVFEQQRSRPEPRPSRQAPRPSRQAIGKNRIQKSRKETRQKNQGDARGLFEDVAPSSWGPRKLLKAARPKRFAATQQPEQPQISAEPSPHPGLTPPFAQSLQPEESHHPIAPPSDQPLQIEESQRPGTTPPPAQSPQAEESQHQELMLSSQSQAEEFQNLPARSQAEEPRGRPGLEPPSSLQAPLSQHSPQATPQRHESGPQQVGPEPAIRSPPQQIPDTRLDPRGHPGLEPPRLRKRLATEGDFEQHVREQQQPQHRRKVRRMNPGNRNTDEEPGLAPHTDAPGPVPPMQEGGSNNPDDGLAPPAGGADAPYSDPDEEL